MNNEERFFSVADFTALCCAILIGLIFIALPWTKLSGSDFLSGVTSLSQGQHLGETNISALWLIPLTMTLVLLSVLLGYLKTDLSVVRRGINLLIAVVSISYYIYFFYQYGSPIGEFLEKTHFGFWLALIASIGLVAHILIPREITYQALIDRVSDDPMILGYLFILPSLIGFIAFYAYPAIRAVGISFTEWNLLRDPKFVGFDNYEQIFNDRRFIQSLWNTLEYVVWNIPIQTTLAILMAVMLERFSVAVSTILRSIMILPWLMPNVIVALLWLWILDPSVGVVDAFLQFADLPEQPFMGSPDQAIPVIAGINIWRHAGYNAILIFAGLKTIPKSLYEAASIDGATGWEQFWGITLPLLRPVLIFVLVTTVIGSFQVYDTIAVTTQGGPAGASRVIIYYITDQIFEFGLRMGTATAASVVLFLILVTVTIVQMRFLQSDQSDLADYS